MSDEQINRKKTVKFNRKSQQRPFYYGNISGTFLNESQVVPTVLWNKNTRKNPRPSNNYTKRIYYFSQNAPSNRSAMRMRVKHAKELNELRRTSESAENYALRIRREIDNTGSNRREIDNTGSNQNSQNVAEQPSLSVNTDFMENIIAQTKTPYNLFCNALGRCFRKKQKGSGTLSLRKGPKRKTRKH